MHKFIQTPNLILWNGIWTTFWNTPFKHNTLKLKKFNFFKQLNLTLLNFTHIYTSTEWLFPKGKKQHNESNLQTASREFYEETNIPISKLHITNKILTENYIATNGIQYTNHYYIAFLKEHIHTNIHPITKIHSLPITTYTQKQELDRLEFLPTHLLRILIRPYEYYRFDLIKQIENILYPNPQHTIHTNIHTKTLEREPN